MHIGWMSKTDLTQILEVRTLFEWRCMMDGSEKLGEGRVEG